MENEKLKGFLAVNVAAVIFGSTALFGKMDLSPFWIVAGRTAFAGAALGLVALYKKENTARARERLPAIFISGAILSFHWLSFFAAVQWGGVALATLTFAAFPFFTVLIEAAQARRAPNFSQIGAGLAVMLAVGLLTGVHGVSALELRGAAAGILSALAFAVFGLESKKISAHVPTVALSMLQNFFACAVLIPFLFFESPAPHGFSQWAALFALGVVATAAMHQLYFYGLRRLPASACAGFVALEPVYAIIFAAVLFGEKITPLIILSAGLIIGAGFVLLRREPELAAP